MIIFKKKSNGFTLIELLVAMAVTSIFFGILAVVISSVNRSYHLQVADSNEKMECNAILASFDAFINSCNLSNQSMTYKIDESGNTFFFDSQVAETKPFQFIASEKRYIYNNISTKLDYITACSFNIQPEQNYIIIELKKNDVTIARKAVGYLFTLS